MGGLAIESCRFPLLIDLDLRRLRHCSPSRDIGLDGACEFVC
jgi:hypothetical protein